jgi:ligand-binding sensor domain-containing protein
MRLLRSFFCIILFLGFSQSNAQQAPIGYWTSHFPYNNCISIATDGRMLYAASELSFFTHDPMTGETEAYSKVNGMADVDMAWVAYDKTTSTVILTYANGNIDLFKDLGFYNVPDLKLRVINGPKTIYGVYTENGLAYLSTSIGIVVVDLAKKEIKETYEFVQDQIAVPVLGLSATSAHFYAITTQGLYRISKNHPSPQIFSQWQQMNTKVLSDIAVAGDKLFVATPDSLYVLDNDTLRGFFDLENSGHHLDEGNGKLLLSKNNAIQVFDPASLLVVYYSFFSNVNQSAVLADNSYWVADAGYGIGKGNGWVSNDYVRPDGPSGVASFDIYAYDRNILVAHGRVNDKWVWGFNGDGFSEYKNGSWTQYSSRNYTPLDTLRDFISIIKDRSDGTIYAGSYRDGLFILRSDGSHQLLKQSSPIEECTFNTGTWAVTGLAMDADNTLWVSTFGGATSEISAKTKDNVWYKYNTPYSLGFPNGAVNVLIDDVGQKWYISPSGSGVIIYNDNGTPDVVADDTYKQLLAGERAGNLPNNDVYSIAKDKNNAIWIGTRAGIGIINCTDQVTTTLCDAERPIVQFDQFAGYLFETEIVYTIAVDGANRKWIGTANGIWLLSPTGEKIIYRFTAENSPLPSNNIKKITVDPVTGDVYVGTDKGLVCYRSTATDGGEANEEQLLTFPNPVPTGYTGSIAIKGLVENADVRITDISGQLVFRTTAFGGQAVWNGLDYKGRRPQSGVYLVFVSNRDGTQTAKGKIVFMQ